MGLSSRDVVELESKYYAPVYSRLPIVIARGSGSRVWDLEGKCYIDMVAGIAVNSVGHCHPKVVEAIRKQAGELIHCSNLYYNVPQVELAQLLVEKVLPKGLDNVFFGNSGAEAIEGALKLARKHTGRKEFVAAYGSFHGRTYGALSITGQEKYQKGYEPLLPGVKFVRYGDAGELRKAVSEETAAVILEPIQGEGGVRVPPTGYLKEVREICDEKGALLILDEIQTGFGRTGAMFACQHEDIVPDILCMAKAMGGGFPIGAFAASTELMSSFGRAGHASTFGGNALACAAAKAAIEVIIEEKLVDRAREVGDYLISSLRKVAVEFEGMIEEVRGRGLMIGVELREGQVANKVLREALERGVIVNVTSDKVVRLVPPLVIPKEDVDRFLEVFAECLRACFSPSSTP